MDCGLGLVVLISIIHVALAKELVRIDILLN